MADRADSRAKAMEDASFAENVFDGDVAVFLVYNELWDQLSCESVFRVCGD